MSATRRGTLPKTYQRQASLVEQLPGSDPARFRFLASTPDLQADGWAIPPEAWDLTRFLRHPMILLNHRIDSLPIGRATSVWTTSKGLWMDVELDPEDPIAVKITSKIRRGYISGVSVNFRVKQNKGSTVTRCELIECSIVSIGEDAGVEIGMRSLRRSRQEELVAIKREINALQTDLEAGRRKVNSALALAMLEDLKDQNPRGGYGRY